MNSILLLTVDCLRADHVGCYGYDRDTTPNVDALAESSAVFDHAYANCPGTRWAFQSLHTGLPTTRIDGLGIPPECDPVASRCADAGYATGGFAVNGYVSRDFDYHTGFDRYYSVADTSTTRQRLKTLGRRITGWIDSETFSRRVARPIHYRLVKRSSADRSGFRPAHTDADTVDQALAFVSDARERGEDFVCWIHFMDAHTPYGYWPDHLRRVRGSADVEHAIHPGQEGKVEPGRAPPDAVVDTYDACVRRVDEQIGRVLDRVDDRTAVVLTGDHGEEFGRYGAFHEASLYSSMTQVPLLVRAPGIEPGRRETPAQHLDVPPTILDVAGAPIPDDWEGASLLTIDRADDEPVFFALSEEERAVRAGDWKYIETGGRRELYNAPHSGRETESNRSDRTDKAEELAAAMRAAEASAATGRSFETSTTGDRADLSDDVERNLEDLGYL